MEAFGIVWFFIAIIMGLLPIAAVGIVIYLLVKKNQPGQTGGKNTSAVANPFALKNLLKFYMWTIVSLSAFVLIIGSSFLGKAFFSVIDQNFSYGYETASEDYSYPDYQTSGEKMVPYPTDTNTLNKPKCYTQDTQLTYINGKAFCVKPSEVKMDLINGITISISMLIIFAIHLVFLVRMEKDKANVLMKKFFMFTNLIFYSGTSLILIPVSIYSMMNYLFIATKPVATYNTPGLTVAYAIFSFIAWMVWLVVVMKNKEEEHK